MERNEQKQIHEVFYAKSVKSVNAGNAFSSFESLRPPGLLPSGMVAELVGNRD